MHGLRAQRFGLMHWLLLAGLFLRAAMPAGYMPGTAQNLANGLPLVLCSGGVLKVLAAGDALATADAAQHQSQDASSSCPYAFAATPALPAWPPAGIALSLSSEAPAPAAGIRPFTLDPHRQPPVRGPPLLS